MVGSKVIRMFKAVDTDSNSCFEKKKAISFS